MRRRLLKLLTTLSLLLCVAAWGLWVQSELHPTLWAWPWNSDWQYESAEGEFRIIRRLPPARAPVPVGASFHHWAVPYWLAMGVTAVLPAGFILAGLAGRRRAWRVAHGHCGCCGYDLRATPGRCPECGAMAAAAGAQ